MRTHRPDKSDLTEEVLEFLVAILHEVRQLRREVNQDKEQVMSALSDLQDAMNALVTEAVTDLETVITKIGSTPPDDTAALQALTQQANDAIAKLKADMAPLTTPAPAPVDPTNPPST